MVFGERADEMIARSISVIKLVLGAGFQGAARRARRDARAI